MSLDSISNSAESQKGSITLDVDINHVYLVDALKKEKKSDKDVDRIYEAVSELKFFSSLFAESAASNNFENVLKLCSNMKYETFPMGTFVFKQNDESNDKFYVILSGEVGILTNANYSDVLTADKKHYQNSVRGTLISRRLTRLLPQPQKELSDHKSSQDENSDSDEEDEDKASDQGIPEPAIDKNIKRPSIFTSFGATVRRVSGVKKATERFKELQLKKPNLPVKKKEVVPKKKPEEAKREEFLAMAARYGHLVRVLGKGEHFGDGALKAPGTKRSASILCKTDCEFLVLDAATYSKFIKNNADKKNEFLLKCFSFISSISSTQIKNKIVYSFSNEGYSEGHVLMEEGVIVKQPKLYLIEYGECKLEKMHKIPITNPLNKREVISTQTHWLPICTVGPGTLLGEEILEYRKSKEHYDYRVTVISSRLSVLTIPKSVFVHIHTELEDQTRLYYHEKKKHRDELYEQMVHELESHSPKTAEKFLSQHSEVASMLNKSSFKTFSQRTLRRTQTASNQMPKANLSVGWGSTPQKMQTERSVIADESVWQDITTIRAGKVLQNKMSESLVLNRTTKDESLSLQKQPSGLTLQASNSKTSKNEAVEPTSERKKEELTQNSKSKKLKLKEISTHHAQCFSESQQNSTKKPYFKGLSFAHSPSRTGKAEFSISQANTTEPNSAPAKAKRRVISFRNFYRKGGLKAVRMHSASRDEGIYSNVRDSEQEILQSTFLEHCKVPAAHDISDSDYYKFVFTNDKETRVKLILKQKHMKQGVFAQHKTPDYLKHNTRPATALVSRLGSARSPTWVVDDSFMVNSVQSQPPAALNNSVANDRSGSLSYLSPFLTPKNMIMTSTDHNIRESSSTYLVSGVLRESTSDRVQTPQALFFAESIRENTEKVSRPATGHPLNLSTRSPPSSASGRSDSRLTQRKGANPVNITCKNPIYENLLQKSAVQQKLRNKRGSLALTPKNNGTSMPKQFLFNVQAQNKSSFSEYY